LIFKWSWDDLNRDLFYNPKHSTMNLLLLGYMNGPDRAPVTPTNQFLSFMEWYVFYPLIILLIIVLVLSYVLAKKEVINNWSMLFPHFTYSSKTFYEQLRESLKEHGVEDIQYSTKNIAIGHLASQRRVYMSITWKEFTYDVCAAPFGDGYFFSYWGLQEPNRMAFAVSRIPWIGAWLSTIIFPNTYYKSDTRAMFHTLFHECMIKLVEEVGKEKNMPALTEQDKTPTMKDIFAR
jgi:hypothetical protein